MVLSAVAFVPSLLVACARSPLVLPLYHLSALSCVLCDRVAQLVGMSRYMGLNPYGTDTLLRFQLRSKIREIKADDQMILWEGIDSLNTDELRKACAERGMRASGLTEVT